jgi:hypothetical protein
MDPTNSANSSDKQSPAKLTQLAVNKMVDNLSQTVKEMDKAIASSTKKAQAQAHSEQLVDLGDDDTSARAAFKIMDVRKYVHGKVEHGLQPIVLHHAIARAIAERNISLIRLAIPSNVEVLDFRALDYWITR